MQTYSLVPSRTITLNKLRQAARQLEAAHAQLVTEKLASSVNFGTTAIEPGYLVFIHTDWHWCSPEGRRRHDA